MRPHRTGTAPAPHWHHGGTAPAIAPGKTTWPQRKTYTTRTLRSRSRENGPTHVQNQRFGMKMDPEACQDRSGAFGTDLTHFERPSPAWSWRSKSGPQCRFGPKSLKIVRIGSRIDRLARNKDQMNPTACSDPSGPLLRPKTAKKQSFS